MAIERLPTDALAQVFDFCSDFELLRFGETCLKLAIETRNQDIWVKRCCSNWNILPDVVLSGVLDKNRLCFLDLKPLAEVHPSEFHCPDVEGEARQKFHFLTSDTDKKKLKVVYTGRLGALNRSIRADLPFPAFASPPPTRPCRSRSLSFIRGTWSSASCLPTSLNCTSTPPVSRNTAAYFAKSSLQTILTLPLRVAVAAASTAAAATLSVSCVQGVPCIRAPEVAALEPGQGHVPWPGEEKGEDGNEEVEVAEGRGEEEVVGAGNVVAQGSQPTLHHKRNRFWSSGEVLTVSPALLRATPLVWRGRCVSLPPEKHRTRAGARGSPTTFPPPNSPNPQSEAWDLRTRWHSLLRRDKGVTLGLKGKHHARHSSGGGGGGTFRRFFPPCGGFWGGATSGWGIYGRGRRPFSVPYWVHRRHCAAAIRVVQDPPPPHQHQHRQKEGEGAEDQGRGRGRHENPEDEVPVEEHQEAGGSSSSRSSPRGCGAKSGGQGGGCLRTDSFLDVAPRLMAYYEVEISPAAVEETPEEEQNAEEERVPGLQECVAVGLATHQFRFNALLPGWDEHSYGYHGDDGCSFHGSGSSAQQGYGPRFGPGDTVGCGLDYSTGEVFFTLNGCHLGTAFVVDTASCPPLYPTVGIDSRVELKINFGSQPFQYNLNEVCHSDAHVNLVRALLL